MLKNIRIWFEKVGTAKYISHLDLSRCMARAIHKAKLPFWYTEGFNPHVFLTITMPISLGYSGLRESMDVKLTEDMDYDEIISQLNQGLPHDIRVFAVTEPLMSPKEVAFSEYAVSIRTENSQTLKNQFEELFSQEHIFVDKHTKKGTQQVDIKSHFENVSFDNSEGSLDFVVVLPSSNTGSINPRLLLDAYQKRFGGELYASVTRICYFNENMEKFQ